MEISGLLKAMSKIADVIKENRDYLVELDARSGDGDLGISMDAGFTAVVNYLEGSEEKDLGKALMRCSAAFNEAAPSTMGTIVSFCLMGMAKSLRGKTSADMADVAAAMDAGVALIMEKAKSKPGEKTILDALHPAVEALKASDPKDKAKALENAFKAAEAGMESTKAMRSVHGRAAYYGEKSIGSVDGGAVVGKIIFQALAG